MNKSKSPPISPRDSTIKIKLLDIFPSMLELKKQQNDLDIIFQGLDIFYNLYELLNNKTEITIKTKNKTSIIISLIKSNNIFATCVFNIKQGEQWITFSYENKKKKETSFAQSLIDCIKIKLNCDISKIAFRNKNHNNVGNIFLNTKKIYNNNNVKNIYFKQNSNYSSLTTDENFKIPNKINKMQSNKGLKNISMESSPKEKINEKVKYSYIKYEFSKNNKSNKELITLNRIKSKKNTTKYDDLALRFNKIVDINNINEESKLNLTQNQKKKNESNINLNVVKNSKKNLQNKLYNNFNFDANKTNKQIIKNKILNHNNFINELNIGKNHNNKNNSKNKIEQNHNILESLYISSSIIGTLTNRNNKGSKKELNKKETTTNKIKNSKTPIISKNNKFQNDDRNILNENKNQSPQYIQNNKEESSSSIENESNNNNPNTKNNISNTEESINEDNSYEKLKEDFILLYNDNYVKNIKEDLLKLESELFVEKMTGLLSAYNDDINARKIKNKIIENKFKENISKYMKIKKLYYKLKIIRKKYKIKDFNIRQNRMNIILLDDKEFEVTKQEINFFNLFLPFKNINDKISNNSDTNKKRELKKILNILLSNTKNKNIISKGNLPEKINDIIKFENKEEKNKYKYTKPIARTRITQKLEQIKFVSNNLKNNLNEHIFKNYNHNPNLEQENKDNFHLVENNINNESIYDNKKYTSETYNPKKTYSKKIPK